MLLYGDLPSLRVWYARHQRCYGPALFNHQARCGKPPDGLTVGLEADRPIIVTVIGPICATDPEASPIFRYA